MPKREHESVETRAIDLGLEEDLVCGACLLELFDSENKFLGIPSGCPHLFHWDCLENWADRQNTCPQCKNRFRAAGQYNSDDREFVRCVKFKKRNRVPEEDAEEEVELPVDVCEKCKEPGTEEELILCDGMDFTCNSLFHFRCVGFSKVPSGLWFCEGCVEKGFVPEENQAKRKKTTPVQERSSRSPGAEQGGRFFPRRLVVLEGATRRGPESSSQIPRNLILDRSIAALPRREASASVFARFRERRLALKRGQSEDVVR